MNFRVSDHKIKSEFSAAGVNLRTDILTIKGIQLHYAMTGNEAKPFLCFLHGSPGGWIKFRKFLRDKQLLSSFRMIVPDRPGYGYSQFGKGLTLRDQSIVLHEFLEQICQRDPVIAIGHSYGGSVLARLAIDNQHRFSKILFLAPALDPKEEKYDKWRWPLVHTPVKFLLPRVVRTTNIEFLHLKKELEEMTSKLGDIALPLYIMHGDKDKNVSIRNVDYIKRHFTAASSLDIRIIKGANHFLPDNNYDEVKSLILDCK